MKASILPLVSFCEQERAAIDEMQAPSIDKNCDGFFAALASLKEPNVATMLRSRPDQTLQMIARLAALAMSESVIRIYEKMVGDK